MTLYRTACLVGAWMATLASSGWANPVVEGEAIGISEQCPDEVRDCEEQNYEFSQYEWEPVCCEVIRTEHRRPNLDPDGPVCDVVSFKDDMVANNCVLGPCTGNEPSEVLPSEHAGSGDGPVAVPICEDRQIKMWTTQAGHILHTYCCDSCIVDDYEIRFTASVNGPAFECVYVESYTIYAPDTCTERECPDPDFTDIPEPPTDPDDPIILDPTGTGGDPNGGLNGDGGGLGGL